MKTAELKAYDIFRTKFGEKEAEAIFEFFEANKAETIAPKQVDERLRDFKDIFASKEDVANAKTDMVKWMFIFWVSQIAATFASIKYFK